MSFEIWHLCVSTFNYFSETFLYKDIYDTSFTFLLKGAELLILLSIMRKHPIYSIMYLLVLLVSYLASVIGALLFPLISDIPIFKCLRD